MPHLFLCANTWAVMEDIPLDSLFFSPLLLSPSVGHAVFAAFLAASFIFPCDFRPLV